MAIYILILLFMILNNVNSDVPVGSICFGGDDCNNARGLYCPFNKTPRVCTCETPEGNFLGQRNLPAKMYWNSDVSKCVFAWGSPCIVRPNYRIFNPTCEPGVRCIPFKEDPAYGKCSASRIYGISATSAIAVLTLIFTFN